MNSKDCRIVFMGTPEFAAAQLQALVEHGYNVVGVVTTPDKPAGRGMQLQQSAVKKYAVEKELPVLQPEKLKDEGFLQNLRELNAQLFIVVAFRMLPEVVWQMPELGTFNLHASLLPQYRGAAPINWAVINGDKKSGVTTFLIDKEIDTGNILLREEVDITPEDDAGTLHDKLMNIGKDVVMRTVDGLTLGMLQPKSQNELSADIMLRPAPKLFKENTKIDWSKDAEVIVNQIRGLSPYPTAWTKIITEKGGEVMKIFKAHVESSTSTLPVGSIVNTEDRLQIVSGNGLVSVDELQPQNKKRMKISDFLRGFRGGFLRAE
jgi:methionyl-tRNA formyltransferase